MKLFIWRHNRKFHSYSMINEPVVNQAFYTEVIAAVIADNRHRALELLAERRNGWLIEELQRLEPEIFDIGQEAVVLEEIRGS